MYYANAVVLAQNNKRAKYKDAVDACLQVILTYLIDGNWGPGILNFLLRCSLNEHLVDAFKARTLHVLSSLKKMKENKTWENVDLRQSRTHEKQNDIRGKTSKKTVLDSNMKKTRGRQDLYYDKKK
jgi:hypothetical protein